MGSKHVTRFEPCYILRDSNIPSTIWCEDAIGYYGVPVVVHSFHILVSDIDKAAMILTLRGWHLEDPAQSKLGNYRLQSAHCRLTPPVDVRQEESFWTPGIDPLPPPSKKPLGPTTTILLPASEWNFPFPPKSKSFIPPLPQLLDALIGKLLDEPLTDSIWDQFALLISYLYEYVPAVKEKSFAEHLKLEHRQFHYDSLSGMSTGTVPFIRHERVIRDALREGRFQLCDCSADEEDESLFNGKVLARIRAMRPSSITPEEYEAEKKRLEEEERREWFEAEGESEEEQGRTDCFEAEKNLKRYKNRDSGFPVHIAANNQGLG